MSIKLMTQVWEQAEAEGTKLLLLLALADMANDEGYCWPSYKTLSKKIRVGEHQTIVLMNDLVVTGWVKKEKRTQKDDPTSQTSNGYWLKIPEKSKGGLSVERGRGDVQNRGGVIPTSGGGVIYRSP